MVDILCVAVTFCRSHLRIQNNTEGIKVVNCQQPPGLIKKQLVVDNLEEDLVRRGQFVGSSGSPAFLSLGE